MFSWLLSCGRRGSRPGNLAEARQYSKVQVDPVESVKAKNEDDQLISKRCYCYFCCCFCILAMVPTALTVWKFLFLPGIVQEQVQKESEMFWGTNCTLDNVDLSVFSGWSSITGYTIGNPPEFLGYGQYFATIERIVFDMNLMSLWPIDNKIEIEDFWLEGMNVKVIATEDGAGKANILTIYHHLWSEPWPFRHVRIKANRLLMTHTNISVYVPTEDSSMTGLDKITDFKIDQILVPDIGKNQPEGGVSVAQFLTIWTYALWNGILQHAPDPISQAFLQAVNGYLNSTMGKTTVHNYLPEDVKAD